jgi:hypothetical protein
MLMNKLKLSKFPEEARYWAYSQLIDYMLDNNADTVVNDVRILPHLEHSISDLEKLWVNLRRII